MTLKEAMRQYGSCICIFTAGSQRGRLLFHNRCKLRECWVVKVKGLKSVKHLSAHGEQSFHFHVLMFLAVFLWRPLAGRDGRTVLCADVDQALAGLEASQRFAAWQRRQGPTQAHHGGGVVLFCAPGPSILFLLSPLRVGIQADLH